MNASQQNSDTNWRTCLYYSLLIYFSCNHSGTWCWHYYSTIISERNPSALTGVLQVFLVASDNYEVVHQSFSSRSIPLFCHTLLAKYFDCVFPRGSYPWLPTEKQTLLGPPSATGSGGNMVPIFLFQCYVFCAVWLKRKKDCVIKICIAGRLENG
jgi:hypothetical protein